MAFDIEVVNRDGNRHQAVDALSRKATNGLYPTGIEDDVQVMVATRSNKWALSYPWIDATDSSHSK